MDPRIYFLMKTDRDYTTNSSLIRTYFSIYLLISRCDNLKSNSKIPLMVQHIEYNGTFPEKNYYE